MENSYMMHQLSGRAVENLSINQGRNVGGSSLAFFADFYDCNDPSGRSLFTTETVDSLQALDEALDRAIAMLEDGVFKRVPPSREVMFRKRRIMEA